MAQRVARSPPRPARSRTLQPRGSRPAPRPLQRRAANQARPPQASLPPAAPQSAGHARPAPHALLAKAGPPRPPVRARAAPRCSRRPWTRPRAPIAGIRESVKRQSNVRGTHTPQRRLSPPRRRRLRPALHQRRAEPASFIGSLARNEGFGPRADGNGIRFARRMFWTIVRSNNPKIGRYQALAKGVASRPTNAHLLRGVPPHPAACGHGTCAMRCSGSARGRSRGAAAAARRGGSHDGRLFSAASKHLSAHRRRPCVPAAHSGNGARSLGLAGALARQ